MRGRAQSLPEVASIKDYPTGDLSRYQTFDEPVAFKPLTFNVRRTSDGSHCMNSWPISGSAPTRAFTVVYFSAIALGRSAFLAAIFFIAVFLAIVFLAATTLLRAAFGAFATVASTDGPLASARNFVRSRTLASHAGARPRPLHVAPVFALRYRAGCFSLSCPFWAVVPEVLDAFRRAVFAPPASKVESPALSIRNLDLSLAL